MLRRLALLLTLIALAAPAAAQTVMPSPFQLAQDNNGAIINNACIWTFTAGTTTPAATYTDNTITTQNTNPIRSDPAGRFVAFLPVGQSFKFQYELACTPPAHGTVLKTVDNVIATPASSANLDVVGVAGQTLTAGQVVYLSGGDGGKNAGQWYLADSANPYSSTTHPVGMTPAAITSGLSGTIRLSGYLTGLTALVPGTTYYVGTAGAVTSTAPANLRLLGSADTATSLVLSGSQTASVQPFVDDFRLTLTSATCVTTADVTAATTLYLTPCTGNRLTLFDANSSPTTYTTGELSVAVPATTSQMYDVWVFANAGVPTLELLAWTSDTARATALVRTSGRWTKSGDPTRLLVGSFRTTTVSGQTEDSTVKRYVSNCYNRVTRVLRRLETTANWADNSDSFRQANSAAANQVDVVQTVAENELHLLVNATIFFSGSSSAGAISIGENSTTVAMANALSTRVGDDGSGGLVVNMSFPATATLDHYPAVGRNFYTWLERGSSAGLAWQGVSANGIQSGLSGSIAN